MVTHIDYSRICLECQHCYLEEQQWAYSEVTPGSPLAFGCDLDRWQFDPNDTCKEDLLVDLGKAQGCKDFKQTAWSMGRYGKSRPLTHKIKFK